jgi:hypothetical protein
LGKLSWDVGGVVGVFYFKNIQNKSHKYATIPTSKQKNNRKMWVFESIE